MRKVSVRVYGTDEKAAERDTTAQMGIGHARHGFPVAVTIHRGNQSQALHLSMAEAVELQDGIAAARGTAAPDLRAALDDLFGHFQDMKRLTDSTAPRFENAAARALTILKATS